jgi:hypothetical protein
LIGSLALCALGACRTQPYDSPPATFDLSSVDLCSSRAQEEIALFSLEWLGGLSDARLGVAGRVLLRYSIRRGCDLPAPVTVTARPGQAFEVVAHAWRGPADCVGAAATVTRVEVLPALSGTRVRVRDAATGGTATLSVALQPALVASCDALALGAPCQLDCQCLAGDPEARCLTLAPQKRVCGRPCSADVDCAPTSPASVGRCDLSGTFACGAAVCHTDGDCPPGQTASDCRCGPTPSDARRCSCDGDCALGHLCSGGQCRSTCVTSRDCGPGFACVGLCSSE